ncbi:MAG: hypothetical protein ACRCSV_00220 [Chlamydiales bacterium]
MHSPTVMANQTKPEFSGGSTLLLSMALYTLQNLLLKVMKMYSETVTQQKNTSLDMVFKSGENVRDASIMQATSMILAGVGSLVGAGFAVGFTAIGSKALKQTQTEMKGVSKKLSVVENNIQKLKSSEMKLEVENGKQKVSGSDENFDPMKLRAKNEQIQVKHSADMPKVVSKQELKKTVENLDKTKFDKAWSEVDEPNIQLIQRSSPAVKKLDGSLRSEKKTLNKKMETLSGEHNAELNKATQRGQLSNSAMQGVGQTSSGIPHVAKGDYDSKAQVTKSVGEQIESSARQSEEARNQTLQSANHINQILDQLKAAEKA